MNCTTVFWANHPILTKRLAQPLNVLLRLQTSVSGSPGLIFLGSRDVQADSTVHTLTDTLLHVSSSSPTPTLTPLLMNLLHDQKMGRRKNHVSGPTSSAFDLMNRIRSYHQSSGSGSRQGLTIRKLFHPEIVLDLVPLLMTSTMTILPTQRDPCGFQLLLSC
jgi:hypothetical protein